MTHIRVVLTYMCACLLVPDVSGSLKKKDVHPGVNFFKKGVWPDDYCLAYVCLFDTYVCHLGMVWWMRMFDILTHMHAHPQGTPWVKTKKEKCGRFFLGGTEK